MRNTRQSSKSIIAAVVTNALATAETKVQRVHVADHAAKPAAYMPRRAISGSTPFATHACFYKKIADQNARNTLAEIEQKRQRRGFLPATRSTFVATRVTTAVRAHIFVRKRFGQQNGKADTAKQIPPTSAESSSGKIKEPKFSM